jgi:hypothetical protein
MPFDPEYSMGLLYHRRFAFERCLEDLEVRDVATALTDTYTWHPRLAVCPCCGYPTLHRRADYDTCVICSWEDDGQDDAPEGRFHPDDVLGGPNGSYSLTEARKNFAAYGQQYRPSDDHPFKQRERDSQERAALRAIFDSLLPDADPAKYVDTLPSINAAFARIDEVMLEKPYPGRRKTRAWYAQLRAQLREQLERARGQTRDAQKPQAATDGQ